MSEETRAQRKQRLCAPFARGHCRLGARCPDRHSMDTSERIPCDCPEKHDACADLPRYVHSKRWDQSNAGTDEGSLLGSAAHFCAAFFHVKDTPEAKCSESCLRSHTGQPPCTGKSVVCVVRLSRAGRDPSADQGGREESDSEDLYVCRYHNCSSGGLCAESSMLEDRQLQEAIVKYTGAEELRRFGMPRFRLYLSAQPCHYSTDTRPQWSCTEGLIGLQRSHLASHGISLEVVCAYPYRAHWEKHSCPRRFHPKIDLARLGCEVIRKASGVTLRGFGDGDWTYLLGLCAADLRQDMSLPASEAQVFTGERREARRQIDAFASLCFSSSPPWSDGERGREGGGSGRGGEVRGGEVRGAGPRPSPGDEAGGGRGDGFRARGGSGRAGGGEGGGPWRSSRGDGGWRARGGEDLRHQGGDGGKQEHDQWRESGGGSREVGEGKWRRGNDAADRGGAGRERRWG